MGGIDRRSLLGGLGLSVTLPVAARAATGKAPAIGRNLPDITVVGSGAFGAWSALSLREQGARVLLLDSYGPGNARQTSGDETRQIRSAYGDREIYTRWAERAYLLWQQRQEEFERRMLFPNGVLSPEISAEARNIQAGFFRKLGIPFEILSPDECRKRWPQGRFEGDNPAFFEPRAGIVKARESIIAVSEAFAKKGGTVRIAMARPGSVAGGRITDLLLADGSRQPTGTALFACGPWLPKLMPELFAKRIRVSRYEVFYIGPKPDDLSYHWERFPNIWNEVGGYAISDVDYGYKVAPEGGYSIAIDPDEDQRLSSPFLIDRARRFLARWAPGLVDRPVVASRVCAMEMAPNEDFVIDTHPELANVWLAGGGSGHAFKMGPATGEYIARRMLSLADPAKEKQTFRL